MAGETLIRTDSLVKIYPMGSSKITALNQVSLVFAAGEFAGLVGPSGSGKTTLLNILGSLDTPTSGSAEVLGRKVEALSPRAAAELRNRSIGFIFQTFNLLPVYTAYENVEFPLLLLHIPTAKRRKMVMAALDWVGLADRSGSRPSQLSGGESQPRRREFPPHPADNGDAERRTGHNLPFRHPRREGHRLP
jgi:putative ABC transport system ATP-binding protein